MIFDCFPFFNELDLLEIRMHELDAVVDYFVIAESEKTHQGNAKPLYFKENRERFKEFDHKIIFESVKVKGDNTWEREHSQRNLISSLIKDIAKSDDIVILSDADEIPRAEKIREAIKNHDLKDPVTFDPWLFYYYLNGLIAKDYECGPVMGYFGQIVDQYEGFHNFKWLNGQRKFKAISNGAWHFSWIGGAEKIKEKIKSCAHVELNNSSLLSVGKIEEIVEGGIHITERSVDRIVKYVRIDEMFPEYLFKNQELFSNLIHGVT